MEIKGYKGKVEFGDILIEYVNEENCGFLAINKNIVWETIDLNQCTKMSKIFKHIDKTKFIPRNWQAIKYVVMSAFDINNKFDICYNEEWFKWDKIVKDRFVWNI